MPARLIHVCGVVQGVGFRPFVWRLATSLGLSGQVRNAPDGVRIDAFGTDGALDELVARLTGECPSAARIEAMRVEAVEAAEAGGGAGFEIVGSDAAGERTALVSPDIATCPDCLRELFDAGDRRYRYPFINCTNCGPRFTVIADLPYDRHRTSMAGFTMCPSCAAEYSDPADRRFHAQPDACFACGPHLSWRQAAEPGAVLWGLDRASSDDIVSRAAATLLGGGIVAIKGLGGFHLACDATDEAAVVRLRRRKRRPSKPLAVMFDGLDRLEDDLYADDAERDLLTGPVRPIVLLRKRACDGTGRGLAPSVAGPLPEVGAMLPYTPLQHLLLRATGRPLVMTSGNLSDEPILVDDEAAVDALDGVADAWLGNDRPILARYDDSVVRVVEGRTSVVRRARGIAPAPVALPALEGAGAEAPRVLACGPEQKATFCLTRANQAFVSQHIGDLENAETFDRWLDEIARYRRLFGLREHALACDMHPEYLSSKWARERAAQTGMPLVEVQHHHAHIAAVLAENCRADPAVGVALDGTGFGTDGTIWGGELLVCDQAGFSRAAHLATWRLPGGAAAVKRPLRCAAGLLNDLGLDGAARDLDLDGRLAQEAQVVHQMLERDLNCPKTSSAGRLFDAVAALLGLAETAGYDGQPACELEACAARATSGAPRAEARYRLDLRPARPGEQVDPDDASLIVDTAPLLRAVAEDLLDGVDPSRIALSFHRGFADGIAAFAAQAAREHGLDTVALGGGVFMNRIVLGRVRPALREAGLHVLVPRELPVNDGGVSYGQAVVARAVLARRQYRE